MSRPDLKRGASIVYRAHDGFTYAAIVKAVATRKTKGVRVTETTLGLYPRRPVLGKPYEELHEVKVAGLEWDPSGERAGTFRRSVERAP